MKEGIHLRQKAMEITFAITIEIIKDYTIT